MNTLNRLVKFGFTVITAVGLLSACSLPEVASTGTSTEPTIMEEPTSIAMPTLPPQTIPTEVETQRLPEIEDPQLIDFEMLDDLNGWGITELELVRTMDSGFTWFDITPPGLDVLGFYPSVFFLDPLTGWVVNRGDVPQEGSLAITLDGGLNWQIIQVPFDGGDLKFIDADTGIIMVGRGVAAGSSAVDVYSTSDGGQSWIASYVMQPGVGDDVNTLPFSGQKSGIGVLDAMNLWIGGSIPMEGAVYFYRSSDGGRVWSQQALVLPQGFQTSMTEVMPPMFLNSSTGVLPVRMYGVDTVYVFYQTNDGGTTWGSTIPVAGFGQFSILPGSEIIVWDGGPDLHFSNDGGFSWTSVAPDINIQDSLLKFDFVDSDTGWVLTTDPANHRMLYQSLDGGVTWKILIP